MAKEPSPRTGSSNSRMPPTQESRVARLTVDALGKDKLVLAKFDCHEGLSELFEIRIDALSEDENIDFDKALGTPCDVALDSYNGDTRHFCGILTEAQWVGIREGYFAYKLVLRPWLWLLGRQANSRIFKKMKAMDIIKKVFKDNGFGDDYFKDKVTRDSAEFEYFVQYRETDLAFVSRIMEEYGFYTYFKHEEGKHVLHIADSSGGHEQLKVTGTQYSGGGGQGSGGRSRSTSQPSGVSSKVPFVALSGDDRRVCQVITRWSPSRRFRTGKFSLRDFDYMKATTELKTEKQTTEKYEKSKAFDNYDYPGRWTEQSEGDQLVNVRLQAEQAADHHMLASGDAPSLYPGASFDLYGHSTDDKTYVVLRADHSFGTQHYRSGAGASTQEVYQGHYEVRENEKPFRSPQITPKPRVYGPQTAFVVRSKGVAANEEIDVDKDGRILVNFHWNREDKQDFCSRRVRVAQMWAGKGWGWQFIPRVGMEVVVEFLEGDPDFPLVTGCVYNSDFPYPYKMPEHKTQSGVKTDSTIDSGNDAYNEFRFEDKKGEEEVYFRAEKDHNTLIQNVETRKILNHQSTEIGEKFDGTGGGKHDGVSRKIRIVNGTDELVVAKGNKHTGLLEGDNEIRLKQGDMKTTLDCGDYTVDVTGSITVTASMSITLKIKGGQTSIVMDTTGITLKGPMININ